MNETIQQQNNRLVNSLKNTLESTNKIIKPLAASRPVMQTELQQPAPMIQETPKASIGERVGSTIGEVALAPFTMIGKFGEGILDAGASLVGTIGGWFNKDFQNDVDNWVKKDLIGDSALGQTYSNLQQQSYLNDGWVGQTIRGAYEGVWQSLPSLALSFLPGGQVISLATLGVSAGGNGVEEALQGGGTHNQALLYGALSGATEVATEKMFGGTNLTNKAYGSGFLDKLVGTGKGRFIKGMLEEGVEEGVSTFVNPLLQKITFNKDAEFLTPEHIKQIGQDALVGGLSAGITQGAVNTTRYGRVSNNLQVMQETQEAKQKLFENNNINDESMSKISADELKAKSNISKELMKMSEERRSKYLDKNGLGKYFNADGSIKALNNDNYNKNTYSPILEGREDELVFKPLEKGVELTADQQYAKNIVNKLNRNKNVAVVFTNDLSIDKNGAYHNGVLYINANANALQQVAIHELTHSIEGSKQYNNFKNFVINEISSNKTLLEEFGSYFAKYSEVAKKYGNHPDTAKKSLIDQLNQNDSETVAKYVSENLFTSEESINRLAKADGSLFKKIYNWLKLKIENYQKRKSLSKEQREVFDFLRKAERLYKKALDAQGAQTIDKTSQKQYSLNGDENGKEKSGVSDVLHKGQGNHDTNDPERIRNIFRVGTEGTKVEQLINNIERVYSQARTQVQQDVLRLSKKENLNTYFVKMKDNTDFHFFDGKNMFLSEKTSMRDFVDILELRKPAERYIDPKKVAHISDDRWNTFLKEYPDAFVARMPIKQFLEMSAGDKVAQREIYAESSKTFDKSQVGADSPIYLTIDIEQNRVVDHEGRHRMMALLNEGNMFADVFVLTKQPTQLDVRKFRDVLGQNEDTYSDLLLTRANSSDFANTIKARFRTDDGNIRYSLAETDSQGNKLTNEQREFFKDSKVVDENGNLLVVYHGTNSREEKSSWNGRYNWYDTEYKQFTIFKENEETTGFFFADDYDNAGGYGSTVYEVYLNLKKPLVIDCKKQNYAAITYNGVTQDTYEWAEWAKEKGYDGVIFNNIRDGVDYGAMQKSLNEYVAFSSNQIKNIDNKYPSKSNDIRYSLSDTDYANKVLNKEQQTNLKTRGIKGDALLDCVDLAEEILSVGGKITNAAKAVLYHATTKENASKILESGKMYGKEPNIYFSTKADGVIKDYGNTIVKAEIPLEKLKANDLFDDELHLTMEVKPYELINIKFSLNENNKKQVAPLEKVYTKTETEQIIKDIVDNDLTIDNNYGMLSSKLRKQAAEKLFNAMNDRKVIDRQKQANKIADFIINNAVYESMLDDDVIGNSLFVKETIKQYRNGVKLDGIKDELKYHFDDKASAITLQWSNKNGVNPDELGSLLREEGIELNGDTAADMFIDMVERYQNANEQIKNAMKKVRADKFKDSDIAELRKNIANSVMQSYATYGKETNNSIVIRELMWKVDDLKQQLNYSKSANKIINRILDNAQSLKDLKNKKYHNAGDTFFKELKAPEGLLSGIKNRSDISKSTTRQRIIEYGKFYNMQNELLRDYIDKDILEDINLIASNENQNAALNLDEIKALDRILLNFKHIASSYDTIFRNGRTEKVLDLANKGYEIIEQTPEIKETTLNKFISTSLNPRVLFKQIDNFSPDGVITALMNDVKDGETLAGKHKMDLETPFKEFLKQHKNYIKELDKTKFTIRGVEISKNQALAILLTSERKQAQTHIKNGGISVYVNEGKWYNKHEIKRTIMPTEVDFKKISDSLTDVDKQYLDLVRTFFNKDARQLKIDTDLKLKGYTNVEESNDYYPISVDRDVVARNLGDARSFASEIQSTYSYSFNKEIKQNAANRITVGDITSAVQRHIDSMANYAGLAEPIKNFDLVYNRNLAKRDANGNIVKGTEKSIREISNAKWGNTRQYFAKYFNDILGVNKSFSSIDKFLNVVRGNYAKFQLGFNVKVWFNQLTSIPAAMTILDGGSISKGLTMKTNYAEMDKYCEYARFRNYDNSLVKSEALYDKIGKIGEISTAPISKFDRMAIGKLWNACQAQVEKNNSLSMGTEENKVAAGKLLEQVVRETQPNFNASERAGLLRSDNFLVKCFTMFMSQPLQNLSLLAESGMEYNALKKMQKNGQTGLENRIAEAKRKIKRAIAAIGTETILFVLVAQAYKYLFKKNDKDEPVLDVVKDFGGALTGMFPIFRDVYNKLVYRYDFDIFALDTLNSLGDSVNSMNSLLGKAASGEDISSNQVLSVVKKMSMSLGQLTGIPTRNILNQILGVLKNIDPELAEKIQNSYNANYGNKKSTSTSAVSNQLTQTLNSVTKKAVTKTQSNSLTQSLTKVLRSK